MVDTPARAQKQERRVEMVERELMGALREVAVAAGIDLIGATSAEALPVDEGDWWGHDQPRELLPEARSVVVAGFSIRYEPRVVPSEPGKPRGRFTPGGSRVFQQMERHCWSVVGDFLAARGYRAVAGERLPIKPAIVRAGLVRYGKHCVVITPELGSMVMWGAMATDAPLVDPEADRPIRAEICATDCRLCVDACPTGAIAGDFQLDRSKCITNWLWGASAAPELRHHQADRMFGCGECLLACPYSAPIPFRLAYPVLTDKVDDSPELLPLVAGDPDYYDRAMPTFPVRAGQDAMRCNAIIALANNGDPAGVPALAASIESQNGQVRAYSAWALGRLGGPEARSVLERAAERETDERVAAELRAALR